MVIADISFPALQKFALRSSLAMADFRADNDVQHKPDELGDRPAEGQTRWLACVQV
jgi:hypothetical protein